jgi:hypothetical protein
MTHEIESQTIADVGGSAPDASRLERRSFIRLCGGAAAVGGGLSLLSACGDDDDDTPSPTPSASSTSAVGTLETDVLNFALQLEYLESNYYSYANAGAGIAAALQTGLGSQGSVLTGTGTNIARAVTFTDVILQQYVREFAANGIANITFLRTALGGLAQAQPTLNLSGAANVAAAGSAATTVGAFTAAARAATIVAATEVFDPYASEVGFLLGAYLLNDVAVSAYRGAAKLITTKSTLEAAAGILATKCYQGGVIRAELWRRGLTDDTIYTRVQAISDARDGLDGTTDTDQGIGTATTANLVPANSAGLVLGRTPQQVLNIVYLNRGGTSSGGFYPSGLNGAYRTSIGN